ncbi:MAG TPA: response regulator [Ginsengibacter sp.]
MDYNLIDILLVEDNMDDAELTIRELKRSHLANNMFHVRNGEEALDFIFAQNNYEKKRKNAKALKMILLDINMPKVNGIEVLEKLKNDESTKDIPVVMLTSSKESTDIQKCYKLGANSYIAKPVSFDAFTHAIQNIGFYWLLVNEPVLK